MFIINPFTFEFLFCAFTATSPLTFDSVIVKTSAFPSAYCDIAFVVINPFGATNLTSADTDSSLVIFFVFSFVYFITTLLLLSGVNLLTVKSVLNIIIVPLYAASIVCSVCVPSNTAFITFDPFSS